MSNKKVNSNASEAISSALKPKKPTQEGKYCYQSNVFKILTLYQFLHLELE